MTRCPTALALCGALAVSLTPTPVHADLRLGTALATAVEAGLSPRSGKAQKRRGQRSSTPKQQGELVVPIDVGVGPVGLLGAQDLWADQIMHAGLMLSIAGVLDKQLIEANQGRVPAQYREQLKHVDSVSIRPWWLALVPETLVISPQLWNTGVYGAVWRPLGLGVPLGLGPTTLTLGAKVDLCYLFIHSRTLPEPTHFLRPGLNLHLTWLVPVTEVFLVSAGWSSDFFLPQPLGEPPWAFWPLDHALWHLGGPFIKLHVRIPYRVQM